MKYHYLIFFFFQVFFLYSQHKNTYSVINGRITLPNLKILPIYKLGLTDIFKLHSRDYSIKLDTAGSFHIKIANDSNTYFKILDKRVYIRPNDSLYIEIDSKATIKYSGTHHEVLNNYLRDLPYKKTGGFYNYGSILSMDASKTVDSMIYLFNKKKNDLYVIEKDIPEDIFKNELNRLWCIILNNANKVALTVEYMSKYDISQDSAETIIEKATAQLDDLKSEAEEALVIDENIIALDEFVEYRKYFLTKQKEVKLLNEFNIAFELNKKIIKTNSPASLFNIQSELENLHQNRYKPLLEKNMQFIQTKFGQGMPSFVFSDVKNNQKSLDIYKNKIIYIELWASWCVPCIKLKPDLYRLNELYKDNENIIFLSISIDQDKEMWKDYLRKNQSPLIEWIVNKDFTDYFQVTTIPRSILIGQDGKIVEWNAPMPNDTQLSDKIKKMTYN